MEKLANSWLIGKLLKIIVHLVWLWFFRFFKTNLIIWPFCCYLMVIHIRHYKYGKILKLPQYCGNLSILSHIWNDKLVIWKKKFVISNYYGGFQFGHDSRSECFYRWQNEIINIEVWNAGSKNIFSSKYDAFSASILKIINSQLVFGISINN